MSTASDANVAMPEVRTRREAVAPTRPFVWSVKRELWEHRAIWVAPAAVSALVLFGFLIRLARLPQLLRTLDTLPPVKQMLLFTTPFAGAAVAILITGVIVAVFYCLACLNGERRDRSILFWKSLPVSDLTAVLAKICVPFIIIPVVVFAVIVATQLVMLLGGSAVALASGSGAAAIWAHWPMVRMTIALAYLIAVITLWYAPIYGWLLLVSAWARRMTILWALLAPLGLAIVERIALDTSYVWDLIKYRLGGFVHEGFVPLPSHMDHVPQSIDPLPLLAPATFLASPALWIGLLFAAAFIAGAVWLRRGREPA